MLEVIMIFTLLNTVMIIGGGLFYFRNNYVIVDLETYNAMVEVCEEAAAQEEAEQELPGGGGFFTEQLQDCVEDEEEDE